MTTYWVFGASGVVGKSFCSRLIAEGHKVVGFTSSLKSSSDLTSIINSPNFKCTPCDMTNFENINHLIKQIENDTDSPNHIYFLARGTVVLDSLTSHDLWVEQSMKDIKISLLFPIRLLTSLFKLNSSKLSSVTLVSSQYGIVAQNKDLYDHPENYLSTCYSAIKSGVIGATKPLAVLAASVGIRLNCLSFGGIKQSTDDNLSLRISKMLPTKKMLTASDASNWLYFMSTQQSMGCIGENILIDNGWTTF